MCSSDLFPSHDIPDYRDQIKAHFGINVPASDSHMAQYIGGIARNLDISEVVNNNLQGDGEAVIYEKRIEPLPVPTPFVL